MLLLIIGANQDFNRVQGASDNHYTLQVNKILLQFIITCTATSVH